MLKLLKPLRRAAFAVILAGSAFPLTASAGGLGDMLHKASQMKQKLGNARPSVAAAAQQLKARHQQAAPAGSQGIQSRLSGFKGAVQNKLPQPQPGNLAEIAAKKGIVNGQASHHPKLAGVREQLSQLKAKVSGNAAGSNVTTTSKLQQDPRFKDLRSLSLGDIVSTPADALGSAANKVGNALPGPIGDSAKQAGQAFDGVSGLQKEVVDGVVNVVNPPVPSLPPKAPKPAADKVVIPSSVVLGQMKTKPGKVIKSTGKSPKNTPISKLKVKPAPTPVPAPVPAVQQPSGFEKAAAIVGSVLSNLPRPQQRPAPAFQSVPVVQTQYIPAAAPVQYVESAPQVISVPAESPRIETEASLADLVLVDIALTAEATALAGPSYTLTFANQGLAGSPKFAAAAILSSDGSVAADAPKALVEVPGMAAGETKEIVLRLPRGESQYLVLALDLNDNVSETDKANNVAVLER